ncbi:hemerythrin domain-containing protein [Ornithinimicrobium sp. F0845]|uniref:hemerythrin domain-containing protein n=1 Tax=Ornithinimicrobium sp. F0845 TaxID=2926412 RepID=UPI001FF2E2DF|nr:hemerythrin domain-containing protein [Ornithinimicrobium sp. F0845]MCK0112654.1 hemerythrin domain-containing protein [Ornithinimicrobium sp. F0845]
MAAGGHHDGPDTLTEALEREHHEIDAGLESFAEGLSAGVVRDDELARAGSALRRHIYLEEEFLFPPLRAAGMLPPVLVMLREHGEIWRVLDALEQEAATLTAPVSGSGAAADRCRELLGALAAHNAKEEPIIYPQGDVVLADEAKQELHDFILEGEMPAGWVCAQA